MNLLAINTSGFSASLALGRINPDRLHQQGMEIDASNGLAGDSFSDIWKFIALDPEEKTARSLIPQVQELLKSGHTKLSEIDLFAVASGPGSFTGLRIGMTTVKTLAYASDKPVAAVNSLAAMAQNAVQNGNWSEGKLTVIVNAFRRQFFVATFERNEFESTAATADLLTTTIEHNELAEYVDQLGSVVGGPGLEEADPDTKARLGNRIIEADLNGSAQGVGEIAIFPGYPIADPISVLPRYFRGSAAEEKLAAKPPQ